MIAQPASTAVPQRFQQSSEPTTGLLGADIGDMAWSGRFLWIATESGLGRLEFGPQNGRDAADWVTFTTENTDDPDNPETGILRGSISALAASGDAVWVATVTDTTAFNEVFQVGQGLSFSIDAGAKWKHIPTLAIFDSTKAGFEGGRDTQTNISNPCWDLALEESTVIAACFSGSSVRSRDGGNSWERLLPDGAEQVAFAQTVDTTFRRSCR